MAYAVWYFLGVGTVLVGEALLAWSLFWERWGAEMDKEEAELEALMEEIR